MPEKKDSVGLEDMLKALGSDAQAAVEHAYHALKGREGLELAFQHGALPGWELGPDGTPRRIRKVRGTSESREGAKKVVVYMDSEGAMWTATIRVSVKDFEASQGVAVIQTPLRGPLCPSIKPTRIGTPAEAIAIAQTSES
jgi:hypothetical protein